MKLFRFLKGILTDQRLLLSNSEKSNASLIGKLVFKIATKMSFLWVMMSESSKVLAKVNKVP